MIGALENAVSNFYENKNNLQSIDYKAFDKYGINLSDQVKIDSYVKKIVISGVYIKDCGYCRYVGNRNSMKRKDLFCKFKRINVEHNTAFKCAAFRKA